MLLLTTDLPSDVSGWLASEKYDGVRAIWSGSKLLSRSGKDLKAPDWWTKSLPDHRLDGELWTGRGEFSKLVSVIQKGNWEDVKFLIFDLAESGTIEERINRLQTIKLPAHAHPVKHIKIKDHDELNRLESLIFAMGGEGVVIRRPGSKYRPGRCGDVVKVKRLSLDEARWQG